MHNATMRTAGSVLGILFAIVGGILIYTQYFAGVSHSETGNVGVFLDNAWLIVLLFVGVIAILAVGAVVSHFFRV